MNTIISNSMWEPFWFDSVVMVMCFWGMLYSEWLFKNLYGDKRTKDCSIKYSKKYLHQIIIVFNQYNRREFSWLKITAPLYTFLVLLMCCFPTRLYYFFVRGWIFVIIVVMFVWFLCCTLWGCATHWYTSVSGHHLSKQINKNDKVDINNSMFTLNESKFIVVNIIASKSDVLEPHLLLMIVFRTVRSFTALWWDTQRNNPYNRSQTM
jgi:hypothetical protein